ncbi:MAG TPA: YkvA family protein [Acidimicrobiia bacterium]
MTHETLRPDEVIEPGRAVRLRKVAVDAAAIVPNLVKLLVRLARDPRVPRRTKIVLGAALAYVASPIDLVPDFIPVAGIADDVLLLAFAVNHLVHVAGEDVVLEHWDGPRDLLELVRAILDVASDLVPARLRRLIARLSAE